MYYTPVRAPEQGLRSPDYSYSSRQTDSSKDPDVTGLVYFNLPNAKQVAAVQKFKGFKDDHSNIRTKHKSPYQSANRGAYIQERNETFTDLNPRQDETKIGGIFLSRSQSTTETQDGEEQEITYNMGADDDPEMTLEQEQELYQAFHDTDVASEQETIDKALRDLDLEDYNSEGGLKD